MGVAREAAPAAGLDDAKLRARLQQLLMWATGEEKEDGNIYFSLSCYTEASMLLYRKLASVDCQESYRAAAKPVLKEWLDRAVLLKTVIQETGIPDPGHPLAQAVPQDVDADVGGGAADGWIALEPPASTGAGGAAAALDLPLPPSESTAVHPVSTPSVAWAIGGGSAPTTDAAALPPAVDGAHKLTAAAAVALDLPPPPADDAGPSAPPFTPPENETTNAAFQQFVRDQHTPVDVEGGPYKPPREDGA